MRAAVRRLGGALAVSLLVYNISVAARYFIPAACWPVLLVPFAAARMLRRRAAPVVLAGALACCAPMGAATHPLQAAYYTNEVACLDHALGGRGLHHGIAQYWDAKPFQQFSCQDIVLAQHDDQLVERRWITSERYFHPGYDFALVGPPAPAPYNIPPDRLEPLNGRTR